MRIEFVVGNQQALFTRSYLMGTAELHVGNQHELLADSRDVGTHFNLRSPRMWTRDVDGHEVKIEMQRHRLWIAIFPMRFRIIVDGVLVAERQGY